METDITNEILKALITAPQKQKQEALRILRGESVTQTSEPQVEPFLTLREVSSRLGISAVSLWRWGVPGYQLGGRRRFRISEVLEYLESPEFRKRAAELREERRNKV